jgi:hypothetical protein
MVPDDLSTLNTVEYAFMNVDATRFAVHRLIRRSASCRHMACQNICDNVVTSCFERQSGRQISSAILKLAGLPRDKARRPK